MTITLFSSLSLPHTGAYSRGIRGERKDSPGVASDAEPDRDGAEQGLQPSLRLDGRLRLEIEIEIFLKLEIQY